MKRFTLILTLLMLALAALPTFAQQIDSDGDGVPNKDDKCRFIAGPRENSGCPVNETKPEPAPKDTDSDGTPDNGDKCPTVSGPRENGGCPVTPDTSVGVSGNGPANPGADGLTSNPALDTDGDGTPDGSDACPTVGGPADNSGCPPPPSQPNPNDVTPTGPPPFTPPALPTDGCYVTPSNWVNVNVRKQPSISAEVIGYLKSGVVYGAEGYVRSGTDIWLQLKTYEGGATETGYVLQGVLLTSTCTEITPAQPSAGAWPWQVSTRTAQVDSAQNPTIEYCVYLQLAGVFKEVCYKVQLPEGCVVTSSEAGVFTVDCGNGAVSVNPLFDDLPAQGLAVPTRDSEIGLTLQIMYGTDDGGPNSTIEYCVYVATQEAGVFQEVCHKVEVPEGCWLTTAEAGVFTTQCRPEIGGQGVWFAGPLMGDIIVGAGGGPGGHVKDDPVNPFKITLVPSSIGFVTTPSKEEIIDLREMDHSDPQRHDDGSTTVEYCRAAMLLNGRPAPNSPVICNEVEIPPDCTLTTAEAGVYTVVCDEPAVIELNPAIAGLPTLELTLPSRFEPLMPIFMQYDGIDGDAIEMNIQDMVISYGGGQPIMGISDAYVLDLDGIKGESLISPPIMSQPILIGLLIPKVQK